MGEWDECTSTWILSVLKSILNNEQQQIYQKGENENEQLLSDGLEQRPKQDGKH